MARRGERGRTCSNRRKRHAKKDARDRRGNKGRTPDPNADAVVRAAERAERQSAQREIQEQVDA